MAGVMHSATKYLGGFSDILAGVAVVADRPAVGTNLQDHLAAGFIVLGLIAAGHTAKETARLLDISPKTADNHIQNIYSKIGVTTRAGAALFAVESGLLMR